MAPKLPTSSRPTIARVVARASTQPLNIGVAAGSAVLAVGLTSWSLAVLGILAYGAMVAYDAFNPAFWKKVYARKALPGPPLLPTGRIADPNTRTAVGQLTAARAEFERVTADTPQEVMANLSGTLAFLSELEGYAGRLVARAEDIARHLKLVNIDALRAEADELGKRAAATRDSTARAGFEEARAARQDEIRTLEELATAKDRVDANLQKLVAVLAGLPTKVVHMRALDAAAMDQASGDLHAELEAVAGELKISEEIMKSVGKESR